MELVKILVIEDSKDRQEFFNEKYGDVYAMYWAETSDMALRLLEMESFDFIFLDYDLGEDDTSEPVIEWLLKAGNRAKQGNIIVHSMNPAGRAKCMSIPMASILPFSLMLMNG